MPDTKRPLKVFLCHASQDKPVVRELSRRLASEGWIDPWVDEKKLLPGQDWRLKIEEAVETSDIVIICLSNNSVTKEGYVQKELRYAREIALEKPEETIFLVPLRLDECDVPRGLRFYQWVDFFGEKKDESYSALIESLKLRYEQKLRIEEEERTRREKEKQEREAVEKAAREKAEQEAADKGKLETIEKTAREKAEQDAIEKAAKEEEKREAAKKVAKEKAQQELEREAERAVKENKRRIQKIKWQHRWETFIGEVRYRLKLLRINFVPILIILIGLAVIIPLLIELSNKIPELTQALNSTPQPSQIPTEAITRSEVNTPISTFTALPPSETPKSSSIPTESSTFTPVPALPQVYDPHPVANDYHDAFGVSMRLVPAGNFIMGSDKYYDAKPVHTVYLDSYYIDKYEVTNVLYEDCVSANICLPPLSTSSVTRKTYYGDSDFDNYPVMYVSWNMAKTYCEWRGDRLLTEAEWEKAARSTDGRTYPWGENLDCSFANYFGCTRDTTPIGSYKKGISVYGVYDLVGNVAEWVADWYSDSYYAISPLTNPQGPASGSYHVVRGSSYPTYTLTVNQNLAYRNQYLGWTDSGDNIKGVRCARSAP